MPASLNVTILVLMTRKLIIVVCVIGFITTVFPAVLVLFLASPLPTILDLSKEKGVSGTVYDCNTNEPIEGATVTTTSVGWGFRNKVLVWDKVYYSTTETDASGKYDLKYNRGNEVTADREDYLMAYDYGNGKERNIGLRKNTGLSKFEVSTYGCKLSTECYKTEMVNGAEYSWNSCTNPELAPK